MEKIITHTVKGIAIGMMLLLAVAVLSSLLGCKSTKSIQQSTGQTALVKDSTGQDSSWEKKGAYFTQGWHQLSIDTSKKWGFLVYQKQTITQETLDSNGRTTQRTTTTRENGTHTTQENTFKDFLQVDKVQWGDTTTQASDKKATTHLGTGTATTTNVVKKHTQASAFPWVALLFALGLAACTWFFWDDILFKLFGVKKH